MNGLKTGLLLAALAAFGMGLNPAQAGPDEGMAMKPAKPEEAAKALCPVGDEAVDFTVSTMTKDGPVYFCCPPCVKKFKADKKKYAEKAAQQQLALAKLPRIQVSCPLSGKPIDKKVSIQHQGKETFFCCEKCPAMFKKAPEKFAGKLAASYTYQVKCPVSGEEIDPAQSITIKGGQKVYFCCEKCAGRFLKDPAKYTPNLEKQGYPTDPEDVVVKVKEKKGHDPHAGHDHDG